MKSTTFKIEGMHCNACANRIQTLVAAAPGVRGATVSFKDGEARVLYDPQATSDEQLIETIERPGYRVVSTAA